jgi:uncharacterized protein
VISLDGPEHIHDSIRGQGAFRAVIDALETLRKKDIKMMIITVINKSNVEHLDDILKIVEKYGCEWELQPIVYHRADKEKKAGKYFPSKKELEKAVDWLLRQKKAGKRISNSYGFLMQIRENDPKKAPDCWAGKITFVVSPDGKILPCAEFLANSSRYMSFKEAGVKKALENIPDLSKCRDCSFSCYMEYNTALESLPEIGFKTIKNLFKRRWFWQ